MQALFRLALLPGAACPAVELCTKDIFHNYSFVKLITNFWEQRGHFRMIRLFRVFAVSPWIAIAIAFSPTGLSHKRPRLHAGHLT